MKDHLIVWILIFVVVAIICSAFSTANKPELPIVIMVIVVGLFAGISCSGSIIENRMKKKREKKYHWY